MPTSPPIRGVSTARHRFFEGGESPAGLVPSVIEHSWQRCAALGLPSRARPEVEPMPASALHHLRDRYDALIRAAEPEMTDLMRSTENTVTLSVREGRLGFCIFTVEPATPVKFTARRGLSVPLHAGATGKILLAYAPEEIRSAVLSSPLPSPLGGEDADPARLRDDLDRIRAQGYAVSREEWMPHAGDISVPLFDGRGCFAAQLGVAGIAESVLGGFAETLRRLLGAARSIRNKL